MKKISYTAMVSETVSTALFVIGLFLVIVPDGEVFVPGIAFGCMGLLLGIITLTLRRKTEGKKPNHLSIRKVMATLVGVAGYSALGIGVCSFMVWGKTAAGALSAVSGVVLLLCLIPLSEE